MDSDTDSDVPALGSPRLSQAEWLQEWAPNVSFMHIPPGKWSHGLTASDSEFEMPALEPVTAAGIVASLCAQYHAQLGLALCEVIETGSYSAIETMVTLIARCTRNFSCPSALLCAILHGDHDTAALLLREKVASANCTGTVNLSNRLPIKVTALGTAFTLASRDAGRMVGLLLAAGGNFTQEMQLREAPQPANEIIGCIRADHNTDVRLEVLLEDTDAASDADIMLTLLHEAINERKPAVLALLLRFSRASITPIIWNLHGARLLDIAMVTRELAIVRELLAYGVPEGYCPAPRLLREVANEGCSELLCLLSAHRLMSAQVCIGLLHDLKTWGQAIFPVRQVLLSAIPAGAIQQHVLRDLFDGAVRERSISLMYLFARRIRPWRESRRSCTRFTTDKACALIIPAVGKDKRGPLRFTNLTELMREGENSYITTSYAMLLFLLDMGAPFGRLFQPLNGISLNVTANHILSEIYAYAISADTCNPWRPHRHAGLPAVARAIPRTLLILAKCIVLDDAPPPQEEKGKKNEKREEEEEEEEEEEGGGGGGGGEEVSVRSAATYRMLEPRFPGACLHLLPEELLQLLYEYIGALPFFRHHYASQIYYLRTPPPPSPPPSSIS